MRLVFFVFLLLLSNLSVADECLPVGFEQSIVLKGIVEYAYDKKQKPRTFSLILHLPNAVCVQGTRSDGSVLKQSNLKSILLGISKLNKGFRDGESVVLRGALWPPADNETTEQIIFAVKEVL